jgi:hypothetical protein
MAVQAGIEKMNFKIVLPPDLEAAEVVLWLRSLV